MLCVPLKVCWERTAFSLLWGGPGLTSAARQQKVLSCTAGDKTPARRMSWSVCPWERNETNKSILCNCFLSWEVTLLKMLKMQGITPASPHAFSNWHYERFQRKRVLLWYCWCKGYPVTVRQKRIHLSKSTSSLKVHGVSWQLTIPITYSCSLCEKAQNSPYKLLFWRSKGSWMCLCVLSMMRL